MKLGYDAKGDMLCLSLSDESVDQTLKTLGKEIVATYAADRRLVSVMIFGIKPSLPAQERLNDFVITIKTETEAVEVEVPQGTFDGIMARVREAAAIAPAGKTGQSLP